jgi:diaminopimelate epimerase
MYSQYNVPESNVMVNLGVGQPSLKTLPFDMIKNSWNQTLNITDSNLLQYGDKSGYSKFKEELIKFIDHQLILPNSPTQENLFVTNGNSSAILLLASLYLSKGDVVVVEDPSYFLALNLFKDIGAKIITVPVDKYGMDINALHTICLNNDVKLVYTVPTFNNPTSVTMSSYNRRRLITLAKDYDFKILADEVYQFLYFKEKPPNPLCFFDDSKEGVVFSCFSFSKILAPSIRLGWIQAKIPLIERLNACGFVDSNGGMNPLGCVWLYNILKDNLLSDHIKYLRNDLNNKSQSMFKALDNLPEGFKYNKPNGGYFVWVEGPSNWNAKEFLEKSNNKFSYHYGTKFSGSGEGFKNCFRLSFSYYSPEDITIGCNRIIDSLKSSIEHTLQIAIQGGTGKLGSLIIAEIYKHKELSYAGNITVKTIYSNIDIIIDVSSATGCNNLIQKLKDEDLKIPVLIGTTGDLNYKLIEEYAQNTKVAVVSNFSLGIKHMLDACKTLKNGLTHDWNESITEEHHVHKKDKPSGTAKTLAQYINKDIDIQSIREGTTIGQHTYIVETDTESIEIKHIAKDRSLFAQGSIHYVKWLLNQKNGLYKPLEESNKISFQKYTGSGNDLIFIKNTTLVKEQIKEICNRNYGIGADGLIIISYENSKCSWKYYNSDGSYADFCGNGARCVIKYLFHNQLIKENEHIRLLTENTNIIGFINNNIISITLPPIVKSDKLWCFNIDCPQCTYICGVPHYLVLVQCFDNEEIESQDMIKYNHEQIQSVSKQYDINVTQVKINEDKSCEIRTFERGVWDFTKACGSAASCTAVWLRDEFNFTQNIIDIHTDSDVITFCVNDKDIIIMEGSASYIYSAEYDLK